MAKYICVLGRQPKISLAELEAIFSHVAPVGTQLALVETSHIDIDRLGGTLKVAEVLETKPLAYLSSLPAGKITLGISDFRRNASAKTAQNEALFLKRQLKSRDGSIRIIPNHDGPILSTATTLHNSLGGRNNHKIELILTDYYTSRVVGVQNIAAYTKRDQARPARDARVGMLPPKLAQILVNLSVGNQPSGRLLDPFCGTGVVLQEALLMGYSVYGTDLEPRMLDYSRRNLEWLSRVSPEPRARMSDEPRNDAREERSPERAHLDFSLEQGNAESYTWQPPINFVSSEIYLGQPFSAPPSDLKLKEVQHVTLAILRDFLKNLHRQIQPNTPVTLAIPAWKRPNGHYEHLKILDELDQLGYNLHRFKNLEQSDLLYYRPDQVVAREILVLRSK